MADVTAQIVGSFTTSAGVNTPLTKSNTGTFQLLYQHALSASAVDTFVPFIFNNANVVAVDITSDQALDIYVDAIHSGAPTQHITLAAGASKIYILNVIGTNPFSVSPAIGLYLTNNSSTAVANTTIAVVLV